MSTLSVEEFFADPVEIRKSVDEVFDFLFGDQSAKLKVAMVKSSAFIQEDFTIDVMEKKRAFGEASEYWIGSRERVSIKLYVPKSVGKECALVEYIQSITEETHWTLMGSALYDRELAYQGLFARPEQDGRKIDVHFAIYVADYRGTLGYKGAIAKCAGRKMTKEDISPVEPLSVEVPQAFRKLGFSNCIFWSHLEPQR